MFVYLVNGWQQHQTLEAAQEAARKYLPVVVSIERAKVKGEIDVMLRKCASVEQLCQIKDVTPDVAERVRHVWKHEPFRVEAMRQIDQLIGTFGVEYLGRTRKGDREVYYCNAGDTYATTVIFVEKTLRIGCWGDFFDPVHKIKVE